MKRASPSFAVVLVVRFLRTAIHGVRKDKRYIGIDVVVDTVSVQQKAAITSSTGSWSCR